MKVKERTYSGVLTNEISPREIKNREISRKAAAQGVVLLKNEGVLPLGTTGKIAVFGNGIAEIVKGGTGSGDVNSREVVSVLEGFRAAGVTIVNEASAQKYVDDEKASILAWSKLVLKRIEEMEKRSDMAFLGVLAGTDRETTPPIPVVEAELKEADAALYIISRTAGEGYDRNLSEGDWFLKEEEKQQIKEILKYNENLIVIINAGGQVDISELAMNEAVKAIVYVSQPGCEAGHVIADIVTGKVSPSGRLATTWAVKYEDFPNAATFSYLNGDTTNEKYDEGIYVGYRYFDSFGVKPLYPFGYGLSYTDFVMETEDVAVGGNEVKVTVKVTNTGAKYSGRQVVQLYAACPQGSDGKELKRLIGYQKTKELNPGEAETVTITADAKNLASFLYAPSAWVVEQGRYFLLLGENVEQVQVAGVLEVAEDCVIEKVQHIAPLQNTEETKLNEIRPDGKVIEEKRSAWEKEAAEKNVAICAFAPEEIEIKRLPESKFYEEAKAIAEKMSEEELTAMLMGEITKGQDNIKDNQLVMTGMFIPGAAGETSCKFTEEYGIPAISMTDGPAGIRLRKNYDVDRESGLIWGDGFLSAVRGGLFATDHHRTNIDTYYMYATAIPVGTLIAQTWDPELVEGLGKLIGEEMEEFHVAWWLAPGMCIHRNPLCGRNFEYYSEDPFVTGTMAAAMTNGVQSIPGVGTTLKHFACNNQEENRMHSNSILSERALREIYIRGFEIAVKASQPMCIMTSYNLINGVSAANNSDILAVALRGEWDFKGIVMTDWTSTSNGSATAYKCAIAGNDLIMPAKQSDVDNILAAFASGELPREKAEECVTRLIEVLFATLGMEDPEPYRWN
ncbi:MAG: glycoside hydrolase family 3 C-terminal domain-containing protein [Lachnospiraceae bacterium]|nr:glycoside hydrolase family 3 C-terminal domain-containing protein [Lachnospiraceae bacterium]